MATDNEKYRYINKVGLTRGSLAEQRFAKDAEDCHMTDQPGKLAALRLTHYYQMIDRIEHLFRYNPAMASMLLAVGGVTSVGAEEERGEPRPAPLSPPVPPSNGKNPVDMRPVSKKILDVKEEDSSEEDFTHKEEARIGKKKEDPPEEDFTDNVNETWADL